VDPQRIRAFGAEPIAGPVAAEGGDRHDPRQLAKALSALL
jgi:hypothetical protein